MQVETLIERAAQTLGNQSALARALQVTPQRVSSWKAGDTPCPVEVQAEICELAAIPADEAKTHIWNTVRALRHRRKKSLKS